MAPRKRLPRTSRAASAVELVGSCRAWGRCSPSHWLHWARAWGWERTSLMASSRATAQQGMADRQHQGSGHRQVGMLPEGVEAAGDSPFDGILHGHHRQGAIAPGEGLDHGADALLGHELHRLQALQPCQSLRRLFAVGADGTEKGETHGDGPIWGDQ